MKPTILQSFPLLTLLLPLTTTHPTLQDTTTITPGHAIILNTCAFPIYAWSVSSTVGPQITIPAAPPSTSSSSNTNASTKYSNYTEPYHHDPQTGGVSIKLTTLRNGLYTGAPQTIFAYNFVEGQNQVWFDLSDVYGDPFKGRRVSVQVRAVQGGEGGGGGWEESIVWEDGVPAGGSQVRVVGAERDLVVRLCS
ncbi:hypothetical protein CBS147343_9079 [Aspergillus niger]|nr:hypothetical protein CBS12448_4708 [Aspergillus niger]KAI2912452.1 hypothetical protein CBS147371_7505 [Aspergillus niger]KAI2917988.1 hypothetical protein CBS147320_9054 [Aspergillus niger]KAI2945402.1 hypothetical protein CBS147321_3974 [Aspergillus niger]KAI2959923.1 hypothetical protein CBS147322_1024 [Aspergillus niger]